MDSHNECCRSLSSDIRIINLSLLVFVAGQDISLVRTEPDDPQQLPCPHQGQEFLCQIMTPVTSLAWTLPSGETLEFGALRNVGDTRNSSEGNYIATLTQKMEDDDPNTDRFSYTSTLLVLEPVNGQNLTCIAVAGSNQPQKRITTATSGKNYNDTIICS